MMRVHAVLCLVLAAAVAQVGAIGPSRELLGKDAHKFNRGTVIPMFANKIGPFHNPSETYQYYTLPFCQPAVKTYKVEALGEVLAGDRTVSSLYNLTFVQDQTMVKLCDRKLTSKDLKLFRNAVKNDYYFQMYFDDLPIWGFVGKVEKFVNTNSYRYILFTHFHFEVKYNGRRVIEITVAADSEQTLDVTDVDDANQSVTFSYSVKWTPTTIPFESRMDKYSRQSFLPQHLEIHWFSIVNSLVTVLLLTGFLITIFMRVLKNDFLKYTKDNELGEDAEETGWKYIHGDVFRFPVNINLLSAILGSGTQILCLTFVMFALALLGAYSPYNRGAVLASCVVLYALTAGVAGYVSGLYYKMLGGDAWVRNVLLTAFLFSGPMLATFAFLNTVAIFYHSTQALPFGTILVITLVWALVTFPLTVLGGIAAKNARVEFSAPCRTTKYPREIPPLPWYRSSLPQMAIAGFLPFSAIYIELYYIFASVWGHRDFTIYSILFIVFCILLVVTAFITIALTYFQLAVEDHRWWWRSMLCGGSTGLFVFGYCFYYHLVRSEFDSFFQVSRYYGYMGMICYATFLMLGSVGFRASLSFVRLIYRSIKSD